MRQYLSERYPWLNLTDVFAVVFAFVLAIVVIWPHSRFVIGLVLITAIPGSIGAIVWALTFWSTARVQIGRLRLRYKSVRRMAGNIALVCLASLLLQRASLYLPTLRIFGGVPPRVADASAPYPELGRWEIKTVVAIAHLEGDDGHKIEGRLHDALAKMDRRLHVTPVILNRTIAVSGRPLDAAHQEAHASVTDARVESLIWGAVQGAPHPAVGPLYATRFGDYEQFAGAYLPGDFKLPDLPADDLGKVLRLVVATDSAEFMVEYQIKFGDALEPLIREVRAIADDPHKTASWSADTRARMNLILGIASRTSGVELKSRDSLDAAAAYFQHSLEDWTRDRDPLEWAMAQRNLADTQSQQFGLDWNPDRLHPIVTEFQNALAIYQARSDRLDAAHVQLGLASYYEVISRYEPGRENVSKAVDYYRAALDGFDPRTYPYDWASTQLKLANALRVRAFRDTGNKDIDDAIAANKAALKVYWKQETPIQWAEAEGQLAQCLNQRGQATSNPADFRQSLSILRQVLDGYPREDSPGEWALLESALGDAFVGLYDIDPESAHGYPEQAALAYRASLTELKLEDNPIGWAQAKNGLGNALEDLGTNNSSADYLNEAIDAYNDSLKVFKRDRNPLQWATVKYEMGEAFVDLGEQGPGVRYLQEGVQNYREALAALPDGGPPGFRDDIQHALSLALEDLHQRGWTGS